MDPGQDIDLLVLFIQQRLQVAHFRLQTPHPFLQRLGVASGKRSPAQLVAGLAFEADVGALGATGPDAVATDLFAATSVTGLGDPTLRAVADLDHFHRKDSRHRGSPAVLRIYGRSRLIVVRRDAAISLSLRRGGFLKSRRGVSGDSES